MGDFGVSKKSLPLDAKQLGKRISSKRVAADITQEQVAERLGIGVEAVSRMERGISVPNAIRLVELAEILGCRTDDLLHGSSNRLADQTAYLETSLASINQKDRQFMITVVEMFIEHLQKKNK